VFGAHDCGRGVGRRNQQGQTECHGALQQHRGMWLTL